MKIFLSSSRDNRAQAGRVMDELERMGYEVALRWDSSAPLKNYSAKQMQELAVDLYEAILSCDVYALLLPGGINSHLEMGVALASGRKCVVLSDTPFKTEEQEPAACAFYYFPGVTRYHLMAEGCRAAGVIGLEADLGEMRRCADGR